MASKTALIIGASRGIGRQVALTLAENGFSIGVASKTTSESVKLPGTIHSVVKEIEDRGGKAIPIQCNSRIESEVSAAVQKMFDTWGHLDTAIYNAGAISWKPVIETPMKRFDLMHEVNARGAYAFVQAVLPHFLQRKHGRIILVSPPIYSRFFKGKTPYSITKVGMTVLTHGLANELKDTGVSISSLWPATVVESQVTENSGVPAAAMRKATIFADACLVLANEKTQRYNGEALLDEDLLRSCGVTDFSKYRCDPDREPPRMMPRNFPDLAVDETEPKLDDLFNKPSKL